MSTAAAQLPSLEQAVDAARAAQARWASTPLSERLSAIRRMRRALAAEAGPVAERVTAALPHRRDVAETLSAEVLPLLEGWRFLERRAGAILRTRRLGGRGRPWWLWGERGKVCREAKGVVLVLCPFNFPLFLAGAPMGQALAAGNAVLLKPGRLGAEAAAELAALAEGARVAAGLVQVLDSSVEAGLGAIDAGVDHVVMTGSSEAGRAVMQRCAERLTPVTLELSGCDSVFVQAGADIEHVTRCLTFGLTLNSGATCIAPRRVWVNRGCYDTLCSSLLRALVSARSLHADEAAVERMRLLVRRAVAEGAELLAGAVEGDGRVWPFVLRDVSPEAELVRSDVFAPVLSLVPVASDEEALELDRQCPYALGASVFGEAAAAAGLAMKVQAGVVTVNDLIVPTADPRMPFGGWRESGFGVTRGAEGLLELTRVRCVVDRPARFQPHLLARRAGDDRRLASMIQVMHGGWPAGIRRGLKLLRHNGE